MSDPRAVIIGAGVGGLTTAALLLKQGWQVTVLEAGATLAGGFDANGPHTRVAAMLGLRWDVAPADPATGALVTATLESVSPHYRIGYKVQLPQGAHFHGAETTTGTTVGCKGWACPRLHNLPTHTATTPPN